MIDETSCTKCKKTEKIQRAQLTYLQKKKEK